MGEGAPLKIAPHVPHTVPAGDPRPPFHHTDMSRTSQHARVVADATYSSDFTQTAARTRLSPEPLPRLC